MRPEAFEIATLQQVGPRKWLISGRAYLDISLNDRLTSSCPSPEGLRVVAIVTYGKSTDLLSRMMTGTLTLEGELQVDKCEPKFLHVASE